jgi:hypothetical protein
MGIQFHPAGGVTDPDLVRITELDPDDDDLLQRKNGNWANRPLDQVKADMGVQDSSVDLADIAALSPEDDDLLQRKGGVWTNRTPAEVKTDLDIAEAVMPPIILPEEYGYKAWTFDPIHIAGLAGLYPYTGVVHFAEVVLRQAQTITNIVTFLGAAGAGLANCFVGLYNRAGTSKLAESADLSASLSSGANSIKVLPLSTPYAAAAGIYKVAHLVGSESSSPTFGRSAEWGGSGDPVNHGAATTRMGYATASGLTALPASLGTLSAYPTTPRWVALS